MAVKWRDLTWSRKSPKFDMHLLRTTSTGFKMAVLTAKSGIVYLLLKFRVQRFFVRSYRPFHDQN